MKCANAEGLLRIIQSVPSPKAEPFKRWLTVAKRGGGVAGNARKEAEKEIGKSIVSSDNYLIESEKKKKQILPKKKMCRRQ